MLRFGPGLDPHDRELYAATLTDPFELLSVRSGSWLPGCGPGTMTGLIPARVCDGRSMPSPAMQDVLDLLRKQQQTAAGQPPPSLAERRATFAPAGRPHPVPDDVRVSEGPAGGVPAHWLDAPGVDPGRVLVFLHGGGFEFGSVASDGELAARLGRAAGMRVLFPEYRLAPEHPFPAALDDVRAVWDWLRTDQGLSADSIAVAGDSAGGGLSVSLLVALRDAGEAEPAAAVLMSPTVDLTSSGASMTERAGQDPISTPALLQELAAAYLGGADPRTPLASPLFAPLAGLPPLLVLVGTADVLLSDSQRLAAAAAEAGVDVTLHVGEGLPHVYPIMAGTPEAAQATTQIGTFLRRRSSDAS
jgi:monoterpene epsilon-lactone hydrolase